MCPKVSVILCCFSELFTNTISEKPIKTVGLYFLGGSVVAHFRIRKYRASKLKESKPDHQV